MKKAVIFLIILLLPASGEAYSQIQVNIKARDRSTDDTITIRSLSRSHGLLTLQTAPDTDMEKTVRIPYTDLINYRLIPENIESLWQIKILESDVYDNLLKNGYSFDQRYEMDEMMKEYLRKAEQDNSFYFDSYLEARLYGILRKVYPVRHSDGRPGILSLRVLSDITPDTWIGPDGTLIITTGMISALNDEDEMMALMAHEVAHFALDHHLANYKNSMAAGITPALGNLIRYTSEQEQAADNCAINVLNVCGKNPSLLGSMLRNVLAWGELTGNYYLGTSRGLFPDAAARAAALRGTLSVRSAEYDKLIAPVISFNAYRAYNQSQYLLCRWLIERNIAAKTATADEIVLLSQAMMHLSGSAEEDESALEVVRSVETGMADPPRGAFRQEALLLLKLGRRNEAEKALDRFGDALAREEQKYNSMPGDWSQEIAWIASEKEWLSMMRSR